MIGRAALGAPWLLGEIAVSGAADAWRSRRAGGSFSTRRALHAFYGEPGVRIARKHVQWYLARMPSPGSGDADVSCWPRSSIGWTIPPRSSICSRPCANDGSRSDRPPDRRPEHCRGNYDSGPFPQRRPGAAQRLRQDRDRRAGRRAGPPRHRAAVDRRHLPGAARCGDRGRGGVRAHRLPGNHGRAGEDAPPAHPRRHPRPARRCDDSRDARAGHRADRPRGGEPLPIRGDRGAAGLHPRGRHREHRYRRSRHGPGRGKEPPGRAGRGRSGRLSRGADRARPRRRHHAGAAAQARAESLPPHRRYDAMVAAYLGAGRTAAGVAQSDLRQAAPRCVTARIRTSSAAFYREVRAGGVPSGTIASFQQHPGQGTLLQQRGRHRCGARVRQGVRAAGLRDRQARESLRRRRGAPICWTPTGAPTPPIRPPPSAASSRSTARCRATCSR